MSDNEKIQKWIDEHDGDDYCQYCSCNTDCAKGVTGGPSGPIYPHCSDMDIVDLLDTDILLEDMEGEDG